MSCCVSDVIIWEAKDGNELARKVVVDGIGSSEKKLTIHMINGQVKYFRKEKKKYIWDTRTWFESKKIKKSKSLSEIEHPSEIKIITVDDNPLKENNNVEENVNNNNNDKNNLENADNNLELMLFKENDFSKFEFYKYIMGDVVIAFEYEFKDDAKCLELKFNDKTVWKYDETYGDSYPSSMYFNATSKTVFVFLKGFFIYIYRYSFDWRPLFGGRPQPIELDINKRETNDKFDYFKNTDSNTAFYIPKGNYLFNAVKRGNMFGCFCYDNYFWEANDYIEYSNKVVVQGVGSLKILNNVSIYLLNGDIKYYNKPGRCGSWVAGAPTSSIEPSSALNGTLSRSLSEHAPEYIKIITQDDFDPNKFRENDMSKYDVLEYCFKKDTLSSYSFNEPYAYEYYFMNYAKCLEITFIDKTVWKYDPKIHKNNFPKRIYFNLEEVKVSVYLSNIWYYKYERRDNEWYLSTELVPGPIELDLKTMRDAREFDYHKNDVTKSFIYTAKEGWSFNKVIQDNKTLWNSTDPNQNLEQVLIKNLDTDEQEITVMLVNGNNKKFVLDNYGNFIEC